MAIFGLGEPVGNERRCAEVGRSGQSRGLLRQAKDLDCGDGSVTFAHFERFASPVDSREETGEKDVAQAECGRMAGNAAQIAPTARSVLFQTRIRSEGMREIAARGPAGADSHLLAWRARLGQPLLLDGIRSVCAFVIVSKGSCSGQFVIRIECIPRSGGISSGSWTDRRRIIHHL